MRETHIFEPVRLRLGFALRIYEFEFVSFQEFQGCRPFGTNAYPVQAWRRFLRAVGFNANRKSQVRQRPNKRYIQLQQRLPACAHNIPNAAAGPKRCDGLGQSASIGVAAAARPVDADEIRIAKPANRRGAIAFKTSP